MTSEHEIAGVNDRLKKIEQMLGVLNSRSNQATLPVSPAVKENVPVAKEDLVRLGSNNEDGVIKPFQGGSSFVTHYIHASEEFGNIISHADAPRDRLSTEKISERRPNRDVQQSSVSTSMRRLSWAASSSNHQSMPLPSAELVLK
ncbi:hypothetical protein ACLOAV_003180 [Pseudogymnoascus australis]